GAQLLALASPYLTNEEGRAFADLCKTVGATPRFVAPEIGPPDEKLHTGDPCPNRRGLAALGIEPAAASDAAALLAPAKSALVAAGHASAPLDRASPAGASFLDDAKTAAVVLERRLVERAGVAVCVPALNALEKSGTFTNVDGLVQEIRASLAAPPG